MAKVFTMSAVTESIIQMMNAIQSAINAIKLNIKWRFLQHARRVFGDLSTHERLILQYEEKTVCMSFKSCRIDV